MLKDGFFIDMLVNTVLFPQNYILIKKGKICAFVTSRAKEFVFMFGFIMK